MNEPLGARFLCVVSGVIEAFRDEGKRRSCYLDNIYRYSGWCRGVCFEVSFRRGWLISQTSSSGASASLYLNEEN